MAQGYILEQEDSVTGETGEMPASFTLRPSTPEELADAIKPGQLYYTIKIGHAHMEGEPVLTMKLAMGLDSKSFPLKSLWGYRLGIGSVNHLDGHVKNHKFGITMGQDESMILYEINEINETDDVLNEDQLSEIIGFILETVPAAAVSISEV